MTQEDINDLLDKSMPQWLSDQRRETMASLLDTIEELKAENRELRMELAMSFDE